MAFPSFSHTHGCTKRAFTSPLGEEEQPGFMLKVRDGEDTNEQGFTYARRDPWTSEKGAQHPKPLFGSIFSSYNRVAVNPI